jgi:predicted transcriptional regulator
VSEIDQRLQRLDRSSPTGAWTRKTLLIIASAPGRRAAELADELDIDIVTFKRNVRKLKALGLTISLETGYRLSPRGAAFLNWRDEHRVSS